MTLDMTQLAIGWAALWSALVVIPALYRRLVK